jgi:PAS domain S-box-containing protein
MLVEQGPAIMHVSRLDATASTIYISPQVESVLGYAPAEWEADAELWVKLLHPEDRDLALAANERLIADGRPLRLDYRMIARDGRVVWIHEESVVVRDDTGAPMFCQGLMLDVTASKAAEEELRRSERRLAEAQAVAHLGSWEWDIRRDDVAWTEEVYRIFGVPPDHGPLTYGSFLAMVHPEDRASVDRAVQVALGTGGTYAVDHRVIRPDGSQRVVHEQGVVERDGEGRPIRMVGTVLDITERRRMEEELELQFERLRKLDAERRRLLEHIVRAREEEAARIARDIHDDPLQKMAALAMRVSMLRERARDPETDRQLERIETTVTQVIRSLRTLLFELRPVMLERRGLAEALRELAERLGGEGLAFSLEDRMTREPPLDSRVTCYRIASEALSNVVRHARATRVEVLLETERGGTRVRISDDGVGFEPDLLEPVPGHLGLPDMRERAELAGGCLAVESAPGAGTTVQFWIPFEPTGDGAR